MKKMKRMFRQLIKRIIIATRLNQLLYAIKVIFTSQKVYETKKQALVRLEKFSPRPQGSSIALNTICEGKYDLQIIIPAYNVEQYIEECIDSILEQRTKYTYKIVIINDGSIDKTQNILKLYEENPKIEIIHQENRGFSGARNRGLELIEAKYVAFVDSDDMLAPNAIERLLDTAFEQDADIVEGGFYRLEDKITVGYRHKKVEQVNAVGFLKGYPCGKVFKSCLFEKIHFPENFWFEDSIGVFMLYPNAYKAFIIPNIVYIYRITTTGITHVAPFKKKCIDRKSVV